MALKGLMFNKRKNNQKVACVRLYDVVICIHYSRVLTIFYFCLPTRFLRFNIIIYTLSFLKNYLVMIFFSFI